MRFSKKLLANGILAVAIFVNSALPVSACLCNDNCNSDDISEADYLEANAISQLHYGGTKNNNHSVYFNFKSTSTISALDVSVYGISGNGYSANCTYNKYVQYVSSVTVQRNSRVRIYNSIYEDGYSYAGIKVKNKDSLYGVADYLWSPDYCDGYDSYPLPVAPV